MYYLYTYIYIYIHIYTHIYVICTYICIYIYICRERERLVNVYVYIYIYREREIETDRETGITYIDTIIWWLARRLRPHPLDVRQSGAVPAVDLGMPPSVLPLAASS